jgi:hypothetical protein
MEEKVAVMPTSRKVLRISGYFILALLMAVAIYIQIKRIEGHAGRQIASIYSQWDKNGKPVNIITVERKPVMIFEKTTAKVSPSGIMEAYVTMALKEKLKVGQKFYLDQDENKIWGKISSIDEAKDINIGMYRVTFETDRNYEAKNASIIPLMINTRTAPVNIYLPVEAITKEGSHSFAWVVNAGNAKRVEIATGDTDGRSVIVTRGLKPNDKIIVDGLLNIELGDKVMIHKELR